MLTKLSRVSRYVKLFGTKKILLNGRRYKVRPAQFNRLVIEASRNNYELEMKSLFQRELKNTQGYFIDVGANFGQTLISVLAIDPQIPYLGIEPQPGCASSVLQFIVDNSLPNHRLVCCCLSDGSGLVNLGFSREGDVRASFVDEFRPQGTFKNSLLSPTISGDQLLKEAGVTIVSLIKIDVEGAELEVLRSFRQTLINLKPTITFEILPNVLVGSGAQLPQEVIDVRRRREADITAFFHDVGYETFLLDEDKEISAPLAPATDRSVRNYVARSSAKASG